MIPAADLDVLYQQFTVSATVGATTAAVHFRQPDGDILGDRIARDYSMRYRVASFPTLARNDSVVIAATTYKVLEVRRLDNGVESLARLTKP